MPRACPGLAAGKAAVLKSVAAGLCLDPFATADPEGGGYARLLVSCATAGLWTFGAGTGRITSQAQHACVAPLNKGKQCHVCLDVTHGGQIDLWDCKPKSGGGDDDNQAFTRLAKEQGLKHGALCLTAVRPALVFTALNANCVRCQLQFDGAFSLVCKIETPRFCVSNRETATPVQEQK